VVISASGSDVVDKLGINTDKIVLRYVTGALTIADKPYIVVRTTVVRIIVQDVVGDIIVLGARRFYVKLVPVRAVNYRAGPVVEDRVIDHLLIACVMPQVMP